MANKRSTMKGTYRRTPTFIATLTNDDVGKLYTFVAMNRSARLQAIHAAANESLVMGPDLQPRIGKWEPVRLTHSQTRKLKRESAKEQA